MDNMEIITKSVGETKEVAHKFADSLAINNKQKTINKGNAITIALTGDLGAGKTTFMQGFAEAFGITQRLVSPTFILMRRYELTGGMLYHLDMYRLEENDKGEIENLGLSEIWSDPKNIVVIEWAEKIKGLLPEDTIWISFEYVSGDERRIIYG